MRNDANGPHTSGPLSMFYSIAINIRSKNRSAFSTRIVLTMSVCCVTRDEKEKEDNGISVGGEGMTMGSMDRSDSSRLNFSDLLKMGIKSQEILPKLIMDEM